MKRIIISFILIASVFVVQAQETPAKSKKEIKAEKKAQKIADVKALVESKTFVFDAQTMNPMRGKTVTLTTPYDVKITSDSIFSYLPYYGVAYNASYGGTDRPMIFDLPFETISSETTKNGFMVKVSVKNGSDRLDYTFHISETGTTTLNVSSINRQAISYYGDIETDTKKQ